MVKSGSQLGTRELSTLTGATHCNCSSLRNDCTVFVEAYSTLLACSGSARFGCLGPEVSRKLQNEEGWSQGKSLSRRDMCGPLLTS